MENASTKKPLGRAILKKLFASSPQWEQVLLDNLDTSVLLLDHNLLIVYLNTAAENLLSTSANRVCGTPADHFFASSDIHLNMLRKALSSGQPFTERKVGIFLPDQTQIIVDYSVTPMQVGPDRMLVVEMHAMDRIMRINKEEALLSAHKTSKNLIRGLAHEIKNPLGGIRGATQLLASEIEDTNPELREYTDIIVSEAERLSKLVDRMLGPNKPGRMDLLNVHAVIEQVATLIKAETQGELPIIRDYDPSIPDILGDRETLIQAVLNVARNAMQSLKEADMIGKGGTLRFRSRIQRHFTIGKKYHRVVCRLDIIDNGPGIPSEIADRIFYPMISGRPEGTGLGLSITQSAVNLHEGLIECDSHPGLTQFSIYLPVEQ
jgi:two-component system, NtrC family, nitrogen regulation sensor histidine kinase GlnL